MKYLIIFILLTGCVQQRNDLLDKRIIKLQKDYSKLIKERGLSFHKVNTAPDSLYLITWASDTTWYFKKQDRDTLWISDLDTSRVKGVWVRVPFTQ